ncbi:MAG: VCBS repeat-containing protein [Planctomycetes bacterium]|nr:VCBS repeat-containing protein [Planctomycetota bacterium]
MRKLILPALLVFPAIQSGRALAQTFTSPDSYITGPNNSAADAATGDFNNDGIADLLTAHDGPAARLELRLGKGTGLLLPPTFAVPGAAMAPAFLTIGDYDNDGKLDAIASGGTGICLFRGNGAGSIVSIFCANHAGIATGGVAAADFDHDGNPDCGEIWIGPGTAIWAGNGAGALALGPVIGSGVNVQKLRIADINVDGEDDLVDMATAAISVRNGGPAFTFGAEQFFILPNPAEDFGTADLTGDGAPEVFVCYGFMANQFSVLRNNGAGTLVAINNYASNLEPMRISAADADGDGMNDLFVTCHHKNGMVGDATLDVYQNDGAGGLSVNTTLIGSHTPRALALADWNGDRRIDATIGGETLAAVGVLAVVFGQGLDPVNAVSLASGGGSPSAVATGDLNEDGHSDFAIANEATNDISVRLSNGSGGFSAPAMVATGGGPRGLAIADLNGDHNLDLVTADWASHTLTCIFGDGAGGFGASVSVAVAYHPNSIAVADLDMDGDPDLIFTYFEFVPFFGTTLSGFGVILNGGGGVFGAPVYYASVISCESAVLQDFDGDGLSDVAVCTSIAAVKSELLIYINMGGGAYMLSGVSDSSGIHAVSIATGDVNRDGIMDIVVAEHDTNELSLFMGLGGGVFPFSPVNYPAGAGPSAVIITDITGDGMGECINTCEGGNALIRRVLGAATATSVATDAGPVALACADFKSRGKVDFVTANRIGNNSTVLLDAGSQAFGISHYGTGTGGASGRLAMGAIRSPRINDLDYNLTCTGAPANSLGVGFGGDAVDSAGSDAFGVGALIHVDLMSSTSFVLFDIYSDAQGNAYAATPIPNDPGLVGMTFYIQSIWVERAENGRATTNAVYNIVTSRGLKVDITN